MCVHRTIISVWHVLKIDWENCRMYLFNTCGCMVVWKFMVSSTVHFFALHSIKCFIRPSKEPLVHSKNTWATHVYVSASRLLCLCLSSVICICRCVFIDQCLFVFLCTYACVCYFTCVSLFVSLSVVLTDVCVCQDEEFLSQPIRVSMFDFVRVFSILRLRSPIYVFVFGFWRFRVLTFSPYMWVSLCLILFIRLCNLVYVCLCVPLPLLSPYLFLYGSSSVCFLPILYLTLSVGFCQNESVCLILLLSVSLGVWLSLFVDIMSVSLCHRTSLSIGVSVSARLSPLFYVLPCLCVSVLTIFLCLRVTESFCELMCLYARVFFSVQGWSFRVSHSVTKT